MTLSLLDQWTAAQQPDIQHRVAAASYNAAITAMGAAAPAVPTTQGQRDALIAVILKQPDYAVITFIGFIASDPGLTNIDGMTDSQINGRMSTAVFDSAAHRLFPGA